MNEPPRLRLHVPEPTGRPDRDTDFSYLRLSPAGAMRRPEIDTAPEATFDLINGTIRVLDEDGKAVGPWRPELTPDQMRAGLRGMMRTRAFDSRMLLAQRQKKLSFYIQSLGRRPSAPAMRWHSRTATWLSRPIVSRACCSPMTGYRWPS